MAESVPNFGNTGKAPPTPAHIHGSCTDLCVFFRLVFYTFFMFLSLYFSRCSYPKQLGKIAYLQVW